MKSKTVLFIEWSNIGRDLEMHLPVMYFFEKILNWKVQYKNLEITKNILSYLVENNQDTLFIIKPHPSDMGQIPLEIENLNAYNNVRLLSFKISIVEAISNSDIWVSFSSGSILEAWLQNIPTISFLTDESSSRALSFFA